MKNVFFIICAFITLNLKGQDVSLALQKQPKLDQQAILNQWKGVSSGLNLSFASSDKRFAQEVPPQIISKNSWNVKAWKGEKVHTQLLAWSINNVEAINLQVNDLKDEKGNVLKKENITIGFVNYVITDEFANGCGHRKTKDFDSSYVADIIEHKTISKPIKKNTTQPIWLSIKVPENTIAGNYKGSIKVLGDKNYTLTIIVEVLNKILPAPKDWKHDLDLWQHPAAIARVHELPLWSEAHYEAMRPYYTQLANAGQKHITASIVDEPWGHQTYDDYPSLIKWTKKKDGSWAYDYTLFDQYIKFVMSCGITARINCYSMVPWKIAFRYYDESLGKDALFTEAIGTPAYNAFWETMLIDFTKHLKAKDWFAITYIAMDERPMEAMQAVIKLLKTIDKDWKISLAGDYHPEIEPDIFDYCVASKWTFPEDVLNKRKLAGKASTWYTCCTEKYPNAFTFSPPAEQVWMGYYTAATNMDGYLRWAHNSWPKQPLIDSRFKTWPAGDTFMVYPGALSSIRFEKMIEGIQDFEKIQILKAAYLKDNETQKLNELENSLKIFNIDNLAKMSAEEMLIKTRALLNK